jgi:hypothetical protein
MIHLTRFLATLTDHRRARTFGALVVPLALLTVTSSARGEVGGSSQDTEGYLAHQVDVAAAASWNAQGEGVKVCVLSNNLASASDPNHPKNKVALTNAITNHSLPSDVDILAVNGVEQVGTLETSGPPPGEGVAMLEIVHRLAPKAKLMFATGRPRAATLVNIPALVSSGCNVIVTDMSFPGEEAWFQEQDEIGAKIRDAALKGVVFVVAAGNVGNFGTALPNNAFAHSATVWEGDFQAGPAGPNGGTYHTFDPTNSQLGNL